MKNLVSLLLIGFFFTECQSQIALPVPSLEVIAKKTDAPAVVLKWKAIPEQILGFVIEKKEGEGPWLIVGQADSSERYFIDRNTAPVTTYYRIRSFGDNALSDYSDVRSSKFRDVQ